MRQKIHAIFQQGFVRSVGMLVGGTAFAQALMVLVLPLLTRLYTPEDFSVLAVYASMLGIIAGAACLRLEIAIPLPERNEDAANLLALALLSSFGAGCALALVVGFFPAQIIELVGQPKLAPYLWLLPLGVWLTSSYAGLQYWATRRKRFSVIAKTRMFQAIGGISTQTGLGWAGISPLGLLLGQMISSGAGILGLIWDAVKHDASALRKVRWSVMWETLKKYERFPKYSTFESLANNANIQLPIIVIASLVANSEAGLLMLATRILYAPMSLIGGAVSQVYLSRASEEKRAGNLDKFTISVISRLVKTGVGPIIFAGILSPIFFPMIFGAQWHRAGLLGLWITPWIVIEFLSAPISMALHVTRNQRIALVLQISGVILRVGAVLFAFYSFSHGLAEAYAISSFIFYSCYFVLIIKVTKINMFALLSSIGSSLKIVILWATSALLISVSMNLIR